jgi:hypothetical protein
MHRTLKVFIISATIAVSAPALARADSYISPFTGANFGNSSGNGRASAGAAAGWMGAGIIGAEAEFGYAPNFFGSQGGLGSNSVTDLMANLIVGVPIGGTKGGGVRPFAAIGAGLLRSKFNDTASGGDLSNNEVGMSAGAGVMAYFSDHLGLRGDVRYFRNLTDASTANSANINFGSFHFWRASVGIVIRP